MNLIKPLELVAGKSYPNSQEIAKQVSSDQNSSMAEIDMMISHERQEWRKSLLGFNGAKLLIQGMQELWVDFKEALMTEEDTEEGLYYDKIQQGEDNDNSN